MSGGGDIPVPTPVVSDGLVYITNAHGPMSPVYAIRDTATGDISLADGATSNARVAWSDAARGRLHVHAARLPRARLHRQATTACCTVFDAKTGERKYQERLAGGTSAFTASPVAADGKVYLANEDGQVFVIKAGPAYELVATERHGRARAGDAGDLGRAAAVPHPAAPDRDRDEVAPTFRSARGRLA